MMLMSGKVVMDSVNAAGDRLTTIEAEMPARVIPDLLALKTISVTVQPRSAADALRATRDVEFLPEGAGCTTVFGEKRFVELWRESRLAAMRTVEQMIFGAKEPPHDEFIEDILRPYTHRTVLVTAADWSPLYAIEGAPCTRYETRRFVEQVRVCLDRTKPAFRQMGDWHLPYIDDAAIVDALTYVFNSGPEFGYTPEQLDRFSLNVLRRMSVARCARVSNVLSDGSVPTVKSDLDLYEQLSEWTGSRSAAEHSATPRAVNDPRPDGRYPGWRDQSVALKAASVEVLKATLGGSSG